MNFTYTTNYYAYLPVLKTKITDCICKHVMSLESSKAQAVLEASEQIGYQQAMWGYNSGMQNDYEKNRFVQMHTISKMIRKEYDGPFRIVIDGMGVPWIDNIHSALRDVIKYGDDITIGDVRSYIVDTRIVPYMIVNIRNAVSKDIDDITGAIERSEKRANRVSGQLVELNYTIGEFMKDNHISKVDLENLFCFYKGGVI